MNIPDETLMAFADGELDAAARAAVEAALQDDPELAKRVAGHVALRQRLRVAYDSELTEPVPQRLLDAVWPESAPANKIVSLRDVREAKARAASAAKPHAGWRPAAAIAASVVIGFGLGYANRDLSRDTGPLVRAAGGAVNAGGVLAKALSTQLAAQQSAASEVHIGVSFLAKDGEYCRTFSLRGQSNPSGLACRHAGQWRIESLEQTDAAASPEYRTAGTDLSPQTLRAVEDRIDGESLNALAEAQALQKDWRK